MAHMCKQGHVHTTQDAATNCYICKRRQAKRSQKIFKREQEDSLSEVFARVTQGPRNGN